MMTCKRMLPAAVWVILATASAVARADLITPVVTQDQANRLSILHDYGLDVLGNGYGDATSVTGHGGGYLGIAPIPGTSGQGAAAAPIAHFQDTFPFLRGIQSTDGTGTGRSYDVSLIQDSGYDSNPEGRAHPHDASFNGGSLAAAYHYSQGEVDPVVGPPLRIDVSYKFTGAAYDGPRAGADAIQQGLGGFIRDSLRDNTVVFTGSLNDSYTMLHGASFLNTTDVAGYAEVFLASQFSVEGGDDYARVQYFFKAVNPAQQPTADRDTVDARLHLYTASQHRGMPSPATEDATLRFVRSALQRATVGYAHVWNLPSQSDGRDYRYDADRFYFGLEGLALPSDVKLFGQSIGQGTAASLTYAHESQNYAHDNSASPAVQTGTGSGHPRRDRLDVLTARADTRILDFSHQLGVLSSFLQFDVLHDGANIPNRHFNEYVFSSGVLYRY